MMKHTDISIEEIKSKIRRGQICFAANEKLKIYGTLHCKSGKRMKKENRIFFGSETDAIKNGFRPCAHCMKDKFEVWKKRK